MPAGICEVVRENHGNKFAGRSLDDSTKMAKFWKKLLNGQATVVSGPAIVGRLSNNVFSTFQTIRKIFEKSRWTVTRQWSEVTRPSDDCQTTFSDVSSDSENFLKSHWRSRDSGRRSRDRWMTVKERFLTFQAIRKNLKKNHWMVTRQWSEVTRPLDDCQTTFFWRLKQFGKFLKKVTEGHATVVGGHATVGWLSNNVFQTFQAIRKNFEKSHWRSRDSGRRSRDRWMTVKQRFLTFQAIRKNFEKSHWRSRDSGRRSRDRWMTVKQRF